MSDLETHPVGTRINIDRAINAMEAAVEVCNETANELLMSHSIDGAFDLRDHADLAASNEYKKLTALAHELSLVAYNLYNLKESGNGD